MTARDEFDRRLAAWMGDAASGPVAIGRFEQAIDATRAVRPRPRWVASIGSQWVGSTAPRRSAIEWRPRGLLATALVALLLAVAVVGAAFIGAQLLRRETHTWRTGSLAYAVDGDVYLADPDGANAKRALDGVPGDGAGPSFGVVDEPWAPDGRHLLLSELVLPDTAVPTTLIADANGRVVGTIRGGSNVSWAPDSRRFAAWIGDDLGIYGVDGTRQKALGLPAGYIQDLGRRGENPFPAVWAADGRWVMVKITQELSGAGERWQIPLDGSAPRQLAGIDHLMELDSADISRDGRRVTGIYAGSLIVANADGTERRVIGEKIASDPIWSPTGTQIAYIRTVAVGSQRTRDELRVVDVLSGQDRTVAALPSDPAGFSGSSLLGWSPGGHEVMVRVEDLSGGADLFTVNIDIAAWDVLAEGAWDGAWQWIPEGP